MIPDFLIFIAELVLTGAAMLTYVLLVWMAPVWVNKLLPAHRQMDLRAGSLASNMQVVLVAGPVIVGAMIAIWHGAEIPAHWNRP